MIIPPASGTRAEICAVAGEPVFADFVNVISPGPGMHANARKNQIYVDLRKHQVIIVPMSSGDRIKAL